MRSVALGGGCFQNRILLTEVHRRLREAGAGKVAQDERQLRQAINAGFSAPQAERPARRAFVEREITYTDGSAGRRTAEHLLALITGKDGPRKAAE